MPKQVDTWNPKQVMLLGDTHGNNGDVNYAFMRANDFEIEVIVQLGDFGYWPGNHKYRDLMEMIVELTEQTGIKFLWIDGNHENHEQLNKQPREYGMWFITENFVHAGRGARWVWGDKTFLACGGAYSIDKEFRTPGFDWFPQETISLADIARCGHEKCDVMFTHDSPPFTPNVIWEGDPGYQDGRYPASWNNRLRLKEIVENTQPQLVCHGHYHRRNTSKSSLGPRVEGFGCNGDEDLGILNVSTLQVQSIR